MSVTPLDLVKCNMQVFFLFLWDLDIFLLDFDLWLFRSVISF
jgi:hypothetical protein